MLWAWSSRPAPDAPVHRPRGLPRRRVRLRRRRRGRRPRAAAHPLPAAAARGPGARRRGDRRAGPARSRSPGVLGPAGVHRAWSSRAEARQGGRRRHGAASSRQAREAVEPAKAVKPKAAEPRRPSSREGRQHKPTRSHRTTAQGGHPASYARHQPRVDPGAGHQPVRHAGSPATASGPPDNLMYRWGCAGSEQRLPDGPRLQRHEAASTTPTSAAGCEWA